MVVMCGAFASGCASTAVLKPQHSGYTYGGEKYGKVVVKASDAVAKDTRKNVRIEEMAIDQKIITQLKVAGIYDESSTDTVQVLINSIYIRNTFNAVFWGFLSGVDSLKGTVTLNQKDNQLAIFDVSASWGWGGTAGGQTSTRLEWLSKKFAEQTAGIILGKK